MEINQKNYIINFNFNFRKRAFNMRKLTLILVAGGVILSGCSQSSTSSNSSDSTGENTTISKSKSMSNSKKNTTTKEVNLAALIAEAISAIAKSNTQNRAMSVQQKTKGMTVLSVYVEPDSFKKLLLPAYRNWAKSIVESQHIEDKNEIPNMYNFIIQAHKAVLNNDDNALWKAAIQSFGLNLIAEANQPCSGWYTGLSNKKYIINEEIAVYENIRFANEIETLIAENMKDKNYNSEEDALKDIVNFYFSLPPEQIYTIMKNTRIAAVDENYTSDFTGKADGVGFTTNQGYFNCGSNGGNWQKNNTYWFGSGNLSGQKYTAKVEYSTSADMTKTYKMDLNQTQENNITNSADTSIKGK